MLPPFWVLSLVILTMCFALCVREDHVHGPQRRNDELNWTTRYRFLMHYMARIFFLTIACLLLQICIWSAAR